MTFINWMGNSGMLLTRSLGRLCRKWLDFSNTNNGWLITQSRVKFVSVYLLRILHSVFLCKYHLHRIHWFKFLAAYCKTVKFSVFPQSYKILGTFRNRNGSDDTFGTLPYTLARENCCCPSHWHPIWLPIPFFSHSFTTPLTHCY